MKVLLGACKKFIYQLRTSMHTFYNSSKKIHEAGELQQAIPELIDLLPQGHKLLTLLPLH